MEQNGFVVEGMVEIGPHRLFHVHQRRDVRENARATLRRGTEAGRVHQVGEGADHRGVAGRRKRHTVEARPLILVQNLDFWFRSES